MKSEPKHFHVFLNRNRSMSISNERFHKSIECHIVRSGYLSEYLWKPRYTYSVWMAQWICWNATFLGRPIKFIVKHRRITSYKMSIRNQLKRCKIERARLSLLLWYAHKQWTSEHTLTMPNSSLTPNANGIVYFDV